MKYHNGGDRVDDQSRWWKVAGFIEKYRILVWTGALLLLSLGFDFKTPHQATMELRHELIDSLSTIRRDITGIKLREDAGFNDRVDQRVMLEALVRVQCVEHTVQDDARYGLPCAAVQDPTRHHIDAQIRAPGEEP